MRLPSGLNEAVFSTALWPLRTARPSRPAVFQMRAVWSKEAVTIRSPSGLKAAWVTPPSWRRTAICCARKSAVQGGLGFGHRAVRTFAGFSVGLPAPIGWQARCPRGRQLQRDRRERQRLIAQRIVSRRYGLPGSGRRVLPDGWPHAVPRTRRSHRPRHDCQRSGDESRVPGAPRKPCRRFCLQASALGLALKALSLGRFFGLYARALCLPLLLRPAFWADDDASM